MDICASTARAASSVKYPRSNDALDSAPADFDAAVHPIIARHFFGIEPLRQFGVIVCPVVQRFESLREVADAAA